MSKTKEELNALKKEVEAVNEKLHELTEEDLEQVTGGAGGGIVFFESEKGFGFIEPENGGKDVFVDQETISCK